MSCGYKHYRMADDCPHCGQKDEQDKWKGARMGSTSWGHDYMCCSDGCGVAFKTNPKRLEMDRAEIKSQIEALEYKLKNLK